MDEKRIYAVVEEMESLWLTIVKPIFKAGGSQSDLNVPPSQIATLVVLNDSPMISMSKLAQTITVSNQQLTRIADELEKSGLVAREQNPENRRQTLIRLTESGKKLLVEHRRMIHSMLEDRLAQLDEQDLPDVLESIQTIRRAFSKIL